MYSCPAESHYVKGLLIILLNNIAKALKKSFEIHLNPSQGMFAKVLNSYIHSSFLFLFSLKTNKPLSQELEVTARDTGLLLAPAEGFNQDFFLQFGDNYFLQDSA